MIDPTGKPVGTDFLGFWSAGRMALDGRAADAYDYEKHFAQEQKALPWKDGQEAPFLQWLYLPPFLIVIAAFAMAPYGVALALCLLETLPVYVAPIRGIITGPNVIVVALAFPTVLLNLAHEQTGILDGGFVGRGAAPVGHAAEDLRGTFRIAFLQAAGWSVDTDRSPGGRLLAFVALGAAAVIWMWRKPRETDLKCAALATATLMSTPYVFDYDLTILALPIAWLAANGIRKGFLRWEKIMLLAAWLLPLLSVGKYLHVLPAPLAMALLLAVILNRATTRCRAKPLELLPPLRRA